MFDVAVIGAGVVGGMIARTLSAYDLRICILERKNDVATGASCANSAIVHAGFDALEGSLKAKLNVRGSELMAGVCRELGVKYKNNGSLVIAFNDEDMAEVGNLYRRGVANGVKGLEVIDTARLRELEPNISKNAVGALWAPTGAIVCPYELTIAAVGNAMDNGAELRLNSEVTAIDDNGEFYTLTTAGGTVEAKYIINAAGVYSDAVAKMIGDDSFTVHPRRGEYVLLDKESGGLVRHTIFRTPSKMGKGILVTPTVDGNLLTGPTSVDMEDKDDKSTTAEGLALVMKQAGENVEGIRFNQTITSFCGLRAVGSTGDFIINMPRTRFVNVAGIESPGLSSAPAIAEYVSSTSRCARSSGRTSPSPSWSSRSSRSSTRSRSRCARATSCGCSRGIAASKPASSGPICSRTSSAPPTTVPTSPAASSTPRSTISICTKRSARRTAIRTPSAASLSATPPNTPCPLPQAHSKT